MSPPLICVLLELAVGQVGPAALLDASRKLSLDGVRSVRVIYEGERRQIDDRGKPIAEGVEAFQVALRFHAAGAFAHDVTVLGVSRKAISWRPGVPTLTQEWDKHGNLLQQLKHVELWVHAYPRHSIVPGWTGGLLTCIPKQFMPGATSFARESVDGRECDVVAFAEDVEPGADWKESGTKLWLDGSRGASIVRNEHWVRGQMESRTTVTDLLPVVNPRGWFPRELRIDEFDRTSSNRKTGQLVTTYSATPSATTHMYILLETLVFNDIANPTALDLVFRRNFHVGDLDASYRRQMADAKARLSLGPGEPVPPPAIGFNEQTAVAAASPSNATQARSFWSEWGWSVLAAAAAAACLGLAAWLRRNG